VQTGRRHGIAWAHFICPSKPSSVANCVPHDPQERPAAVSAPRPSPLSSTSVSCHRCSVMSVISPRRLRHEVLRPSYVVDFEIALHERARIHTPISVPAVKPHDAAYSTRSGLSAAASVAAPIQVIYRLLHLLVGVLLLARVVP
jgi:hypothetical protein